MSLSLLIGMEEKQKAIGSVCGLRGKDGEGGNLF